MAIWGVVRLPDGVDAAAGVGDGAVAADVAALLDGLVAVAERTPWADVLATLPEGVRRIVELDATTATDPEGGAAVRALLDVGVGVGVAEDLTGEGRTAGGPAGGHAAVVSSRPLADALKRVDGDVVIEGLERDGLRTPGLPALIDRDRLAAAVAAVDPVDAVDPGDAVASLLDAGHAVLVVGHDGPPVTVRRRAGG